MNVSMQSGGAGDVPVRVVSNAAVPARVQHSGGDGFYFQSREAITGGNVSQYIILVYRKESNTISLMSASVESYYGKKGSAL